MSINKILVSVVIPLYNRANVIKRTVQSVLNQTFHEFEIIVVDDGSTDNPEIVLNEIDDDRIKLVRHETNQNGSVARNTGIKLAQGKYIAFLDSDDEWFDNHLEKRVAKIESIDCDGVYGSCEVHFRNKVIQDRTRALNENETMIEFLFEKRMALKTPTIFMKSGCAKNTLFDPKLNAHQNFDFSIRFVKKYTYYCDPDITVKVHWEGQKRMGNITHFESSLYFLDLYQSMFPVPALIDFNIHMLAESIRQKKEIALQEEFVKNLTPLRGLFNRKQKLKYLLLRSSLNSLVIGFYNLIIGS
jgi:glycosyltransferase involved in cell wall biosynthesis